MLTCKFCERKCANNSGLGKHEICCNLNPNRVSGKNHYSYGAKMSDAQREQIRISSTGRKHSEETKKKISEIRIKYLKDNPDKVPYLLNHYSKGDSFPEKYFEEAFINEGIFLMKKYRIGTYELDFCDVDRKIDIEIDGSQHYKDPKIIKSDIKRTEYLTNLGWEVYRINWSEFQKKTFIEKSQVIEDIKILVCKH